MSGDETDMNDSDNVIVAVRIRPFNDREIVAGSHSTVNIVGLSVVLRPLKHEHRITPTDEERFFTFDRCYRSFGTDESYSEGGPIGTQAQIHSDLGRLILNNAQR
eukprot:528904_1